MSGYSPGLIQAAVEQAARAAAEAVAEVALERTPTDTGGLDASQRVEQDGAHAVIAYDSPYAVRQHEDVRLPHNDGQAKFLESAMHDGAGKAAQAAARAAREVLGG